jgi:dTDP-4-amino-4,6-dideoxygalactose transaminase
MISDRKIPILDLKPGYEAHRPEITDAIERVIESGQFIMGPDVTAFEQEAAAYLGTKHAIAVNSGTDALVIALHALGIGEDDEVITTPFTFFATAEAIGQVRARPIFVDIDPVTFNLDCRAVEAAVTKRTRAILPVHLYGRSADMMAISDIAAKYDLRIIEDCAQRFGAHDPKMKRQTGTIGDMGAFSFFPSKTLGAFGDGGLIVTNNDSAADLARALRVHGSRKKYFNEMLGYNSRLDTIQAAILRVKLRYIDEANAGRRRAATVYSRLLADVAGVTVPVVSSDQVFHQYTIRVERRRDAVAAKLASVGISTMVYYPVPVHRLPLYASEDRSLPEAELAATEVLSLPVWPEIDDATIGYIAEHVRLAVDQG